MPRTQNLEIFVTTITTTTDRQTDCFTPFACARGKNVRKAYLITQIMFSIDSRCTAPFHTQITDIIDCCGGSSELVRTLNRLRVCSSYDTLLRHIQECTKELTEKGILQGMDPSVLTIFSMDNIDFLKSHAQVYCGNQKLSWHGTTIQAIQPLTSIKDGPTENRRRSRDSSPPSQSARKKYCGRARTGKELAEQANTAQLPLSDSFMYHFEDTSNFVHNTILTIDLFRPVEEEHSALSAFGKRLLHYCLLKDSYQVNNVHILENLSDIDTTQAVNMVHMQEFCALYDKHLQPDVASVVYVNVRTR